ncbi:MAG: DUF2809 domain-containing protein [Bacteroidales bacterium]
MRSGNRRVWRHAGTLVPVTVLGLATKFYEGPGQTWVHNSLGGVFYVMFWILLASLFLAGIRTWKIALWVLLTTVALEFLQLWHPPILQSVRGTFLGAALLGNTFVWRDMLHYLAGALAGLGLLTWVRRPSDSGH